MVKINSTVYIARLALPLSLLILLPTICGAQQLARTVTVAVDNDFFDFSRPPRQRPDDNYTQGARLSWDFSRAPRLARRLVCRDRAACGATFEFGQEMYTPFYGGYYPVPGDRPYAGWLYGRLAVAAATAGGHREMSMTVGVTGPPSLAGSAQRAFHHLVPGFYEPIGWDHQLPTEVDFGISAARTWRVAPHGAAGSYVDLLPRVAGTAGTVRMSIGAGVRARVGVPLEHPWLVSPHRAFAPYGFVGIAGEAVGRDMFLDGTAFRDSPRVDHEPAVATWERGVGVHLRRLGIEYRAVTRTREYPAGPATHTYGSIALSWMVR